MANFEIRGTLGNKQPVVDTIKVNAGTDSSIKAGDLVVLNFGRAFWMGNGSGAEQSKGKYAIALRDSTETAAADGTVEIAFATDGLVVRGKTTGVADDSMLYKSFTIDAVNRVQTIDEDDAGDITIIKIHEDGDVDAVLPFKL